MPLVPNGDSRCPPCQEGDHHNCVSTNGDPNCGCTCDPYDLEYSDPEEWYGNP